MRQRKAQVARRDDPVASTTQALTEALDHAAELSRMRDEDQCKRERVRELADALTVRQVQEVARTAQERGIKATQLTKMLGRAVSFAKCQVRNGHGSLVRAMACGPCFASPTPNLRDDIEQVTAEQWAACVDIEEGLGDDESVMADAAWARDDPGLALRLTTEEWDFPMSRRLVEQYDGFPVEVLRALSSMGTGRFFDRGIARQVNAEPDMLELALDRAEPVRPSAHLPGSGPVWGQTPVPYAIGNPALDVAKAEGALSTLVSGPWADGDARRSLHSPHQQALSAAARRPDVTPVIVKLVMKKGSTYALVDLATNESVPENQRAAARALADSIRVDGPPWRRVGIDEI